MESLDYKVEKCDLLGGSDREPWVGHMEFRGRDSRAGPGVNGTSIIDLTLSTPAMSLNWSLLEGEATGSDHEVILWEIIEEGEKAERSTAVTGWDISSWSTRGKPEKERKEVERKAEQARATFNQLTRHISLNDESTEDKIEESAIALRTAMTETLEWHAKQRCWCTRSKRWWTDELRDLRKILGRSRRKWDWEADGGSGTGRQHRRLSATNEERSGEQRRSAGTHFYRRQRERRYGRQRDTRHPGWTKQDRRSEWRGDHC